MSDSKEIAPLFRTQTPSLKTRSTISVFKWTKYLIIYNFVLSLFQMWKIHLLLFSTYLYRILGVLMNAIYAKRRLKHLILKRKHANTHIILYVEMRQRNMKKILNVLYQINIVIIIKANTIIERRGKEKPQQML